MCACVRVCARVRARVRVRVHVRVRVRAEVHAQQHPTSVDDLSTPISHVSCTFTASSQVSTVAVRWLLAY